MWRGVGLKPAGDCADQACVDLKYRFPVSSNTSVGACRFGLIEFVGLFLDIVKIGKYLLTDDMMVLPGAHTVGQIAAVAQCAERRESASHALRKVVALRLIA